MFAKKVKNLFFPEKRKAKTTSKEKNLKKKTKIKNEKKNIIIFITIYGGRGGHDTIFVCIFF